MPRSLVGFFKYVWEGGRSVFLPILRILLIFDVLSFCQLGTNNTAELSAFGEERPAAIEMFCDVSWHCDTNTVYINISYIMYTYIYVYIYIYTCLRHGAHAILCLEFYATNLGSNFGKNMHTYIYILWSQLFHEWFWMILNDRGWICASNASSLGLAMVAWWSTRWRRESSGDALWLAVCQEGCYWLIVMLERLGESSFAFAICRASSLFNHIVMNIHINWHCNV